MGVSSGSAREDAESRKADEVAPLKIFINYRRTDSPGTARALFDRLKGPFGEDNVFFDVEALPAGTRWLQDIRSRGSTDAVFLALIGQRWASIMRDRARSSEEDYVKTEIRLALRGDSTVKRIIPVLVDDAVMPGERDLPAMQSLWPLLDLQTANLRPSSWDADVHVLIERLKEIPAELEAERKREKRKGDPKPPPEVPKQPDPDHGEKAAAPAPDLRHYEEVAGLMTGGGDGLSFLVPFLGPGANSGDRTEAWAPINSPYVPDAEELAAYLADSEATSEPGALAQASQFVSVDQGKRILYKMLKRALPMDRCPPSSVHRFFAGLPGAQRDLGLAERYQVIVTTNYDDALEQAFSEAREPYDLAVYVASGPDKGRFVHVPHEGEPQTVEKANEYYGFPLDEDGEAHRTVIMKIHGAIDSKRGPWRDNYVITEDDYINYLSGGGIKSIVPGQLLNHLRDNHLLFLGFTMRDWNLRVFLKRLFAGFGEQPENDCWAIQRQPDRLDKKFWKRIGVELFAISLDEYVTELRQSLEATAGAAEPAA